MSKFKVGDKVVCIEENPWIPVGTVGTINKDDGTSTPYVAWNDDDKYYYLPDSFMRLYNPSTINSPIFKVGDRVRLITHSYEDEWKLPYGSEGTVCGIRKTTGSIDVSFDNFELGHEGDSGDSFVHSHLFIRPEQLQPIQDKVKLVVVTYRKGNTVVAELHYGKEVVARAEAKCNPEDNFSFLIGSQIALQRMARRFRGDNKTIAVPEDMPLNKLFMY